MNIWKIRIDIPRRGNAAPTSAHYAVAAVSQKPAVKLLRKVISTTDAFVSVVGLANDGEFDWTDMQNGDVKYIATPHKSDSQAP